MTNDELIERLGKAQQKVMSLTVVKRQLEKRLETIEERAERLEELIMEIYMSGQLNEEMTQTVTAEMVKIGDEEKAARHAPFDD
jgi:primosomal replication protein N